MNIIANILCALGLHNWTKWKNYKHKVYYPTGRLMELELRQRRECLWCGETEDYPVGVGFNLPLEANEEGE